MGAAAVVAALMLVAAGCGGSNEVGSTATEATASTESVATATDTETKTAADETETSSDAVETTSTGVTGLTGACQDLAEVSQKFGEAMAAATSGTGSDLEATSKVFDAFADEVPDEVREHFQVLAESFAVYADALKGIDLKPGATPSADQVAKLVQATQALDQEKLSKASAGIDAWVKENCGVAP
jgi:hypothetical protein